LHIGKWWITKDTWRIASVFRVHPTADKRVQPCIGSSAIPERGCKICEHMIKNDDLGESVRSSRARCPRSRSNVRKNTSRLSRWKHLIPILPVKTVSHSI